MQHTSPLEKGRKRGDYLYRTDGITSISIKNATTFQKNAAAFLYGPPPAKKINGDGEKALPANVQAIALQDPVSPMAIGANRPYRKGNPCRCNAWNY